MLSYNDKEAILANFPNIKLSYENIVHKKVYNTDFNLAIPEGQKCFAWFTTFNENNVCLILYLKENKKIQDIKIYNACFSNELSYGTILYGTVLNYSHNTFFYIEDIFIFKGKNVERENWGNKLFIFKDLLENNLKQVSYNNSFIVFGLPIITSNLDDMVTQLEQVKYKINSIQFRSFNRKNNYLFISYKLFTFVNKSNSNINKNNINNINNINNSFKREKQVQYNKQQLQKYIFNVKPDLQQDIYYLYCLNDDNVEHYIGLANIPDYNTSVIMNKLFRVIKENNNLDALEESDDEEEFENEKEDRFVYLNKEYKMECVYNYKFKKWKPVKLADNNSKITLLKNIYR